MKANELRQKSIEELKKEHLALLQELFNLRMQDVTSQSKRTDQFKKVRRDIARVLTIVKEKMGSEA